MIAIGVRAKDFYLNQRKENNMAVRVEIKSEIGTSRDPAKVSIYENDRLLAEVIAEIELKQGADGGWYHCVTLRKEVPVQKTRVNSDYHDFQDNL